MNRSDKDTIETLSDLLLVISVLAVGTFFSDSDAAKTAIAIGVLILGYSRPSSKIARLYNAYQLRQFRPAEKAVFAGYTDYTVISRRIPRGSNTLHVIGRTANERVFGIAIPKDATSERDCITVGDLPAPAQVLFKAVNADTIKSHVNSCSA